MSLDRSVCIVRPKKRLAKALCTYKMEVKSDFAELNEPLVASVPYKLVVKSPTLTSMRGRTLNRFDPMTGRPAKARSKHQLSKSASLQRTSGDGTLASPSMLTASFTFGETASDAVVTEGGYFSIPTRDADAFIPHAAATAALPLNAAYMLTKPRLASNKTIKANILPLPPLTTRVVSKKIVSQRIGQQLGIDADEDLSVMQLYELSAQKQALSGQLRRRERSMIRDADDRGLYLGVTRRADAAAAAASVVSGAANPRINSWREQYQDQLQS
jgi:hypothetical protein